MIEYLKDCTSPDTAVVVDDYPYGYVLRCKIRYWLEWKAGHGVRLVSQTTDPRHGHRWNKPKAGVYIKGWAVLYRNTENGHISVSEYDMRAGKVDVAQAFFDTKSAYLPEAQIPEFKRYIATLTEYNRLMSQGMNFREASLTATLNTSPAKSLKKELLSAIINRFTGDDDHARIDTIIAGGTIGQLKDFLAARDLTIASFKKDPTCILCENNEEPGHDH